MKARILKFYPKGTARPAARTRRVRKPAPSDEAKAVIEMLKSMFTPEEIAQIKKEFQ